MYLNSQE